LYSALHLKVGH